MTNPIMPGIEKLAEKYGIIPNKTKLNVSNEFSIGKGIFEYIINNVELEKIGDSHDYKNYILSKCLLDGGKTHHLSEWTSKSEYRVVDLDKIEFLYKIPTSKNYFQILNTLRINKDGKFKDQIEIIRDSLQYITKERFHEYELITDTRINHIKSLNNSQEIVEIIHNKNTIIEEKFNIMLNNSMMSIIENSYFELISNMLTGLSVSDLLQTTKWFNGNEPYLLNLNSKGDQRIVSLKYNKNLFYINCSLPDNIDLPSLGVKEI